jgi:hypothetical protein
MAQANGYDDASSAASRKGSRGTSLGRRRKKKASSMAECFELAALERDADVDMAMDDLRLIFFVADVTERGHGERYKIN